MKATLFLTIVSLVLVTEVFAYGNHFHNSLHGRSPGMPDNRNPETQAEDLGEQLPGNIPGEVVPNIKPEGLGSTYCKSGFGFCGPREACCEMGGVCCPMGGCCNEPGMGCFPDKDGKTHCCNATTEKLCTSKSCIPKNTVCCDDGYYCAAGSYCVKGGCCKAGMICKRKTGAKSGGADTRAVKPQKIKAPPG